MRVLIELNTDTAAFDEDLSAEMFVVFEQAYAKVLEQKARRTTGVLCTAPEEADKLRDSNGNVVGKITIAEDPADAFPGPKEF